MDISIVLTQFFGMIFVVIGLSMTMNTRVVTTAIEEAAHNKGLLWILGLIALTMGSALIVLNNTWTSGLPLLVTILSWLAFLKGCWILIFPNQTASIYSKYVKGNMLMVWGAVVFILGLIFLYWGFM